MVGIARKFFSPQVGASRASCCELVQGIAVRRERLRFELRNRGSGAGTPKKFLARSWPLNRGLPRLAGDRRG